MILLEWLAFEEEFAMNKSVGGTSNSLPAPSDDSMNAVLELAGSVLILAGGPYAHVAVSILKVLNTFRKDYQIPPEHEKYFEALERLTEAYNRRRGGQKK